MPVRVVDFLLRKWLYGVDKMMLRKLGQRVLVFSFRGNHTDRMTAEDALF